MFGLPDAERWRRVLLCSVALLAVGVHGVAPWPPLRRVLDASVDPLRRVLLPDAAWLAEALAPATAEEPVRAQAPPSLAAVERLLGTPPGGLGVAWLEAPVLERRDREGELLLAAGSDLGVAPGQPIVYGRSWLGRVVEVGARAARVLLWTAPDARTGVLLLDELGNSLRGVTQGRRAGKAPVVAWLEGAPWVHPGMEVLWRRGEQDPAGLQDAGFSLGRLSQGGDPARGESLWVVAGQLPAGAEGRVFVGVGAVGERLVADPPLVRHSAHAGLRLDAVLGPDLRQAVAPERVPAAVALAGGRVLGPVLARRGATVWYRPLPPSAWREEALALDPAVPAILPFPQGRGQGLQLFTRGSGGIPRGLWLGPGGQRRPAVAGDPVDLVARAPLELEP